MKTRRTLLIYILIGFLSFSVYSQANENGKILITGSRFTYPLLERWISGFKEIYPSVEIRILPRKSSSEDSANLIINAHKLLPQEIKAGFDQININRYILLSIINTQNPLNEDFLKSGITGQDVKDLYFEKAIFEQEKIKKKKAFSPTVYTREEKACAPTAFANHYGFTQENFKGKTVSGDDKYLIYALKKDSSAISYNVSTYIYDYSTRKVKDGITVIPYDLNENGKVDGEEKFYHSLDALIEAVETNEYKSVPVEYVNISYPKSISLENNNLRLFLDFILSEGQKYNHEFGFLNLDNDYLAKQKEVLLGNKN